MSLQQQIALARARAASFGFGFGPDIDWGDTIGGDLNATINDFPSDGGGSFPSSGGGSSNPPWYVGASPILIGAEKALSNIFSPWQATASQYQAAAFRPVGQQQYVQPPPGYGYDSSGRLIKQSFSNVTDFISNNFLLVGAGVLGVILLFRTPPGRR